MMKRSSSAAKGAFEALRKKTSTLSRLYFSAFLSVAQAVITVQSEPRIIKDGPSELSRDEKR